MKRLCAMFLVFAAVMMLSVPISAAKEIVAPSEALYVSDYADVLSPDTESHIVSSVQALKAACGGEIAVVTVDFLTGGLDSEEYAYEIINQWGVGDKEKQNGCVLLLVIGEGKGWCTVGTGAEQFLSAGRLEQILNDHLWTPFDAGRYDEAVLATFSALISRYESHYGIAAEGEAAYEHQQAEPLPVQNIGRRVSFGEVLFIMLIIFIMLNNGGGRIRRARFFHWFVYPTHTHHHHHYGGHSGGSFRSGGSRGGGSRGGGSFGGGGGRGGGAGRR